MDPLYMFLFLALFPLVMGIVGSILKNQRAGSEKYQKMLSDFQAKVDSMLEPGETVEAVCGYVPCAAVTNKRLLVDTKAGVDSVAFTEIKSLSGMNATGSKTNNPAQMLAFTIVARKKYVLGNHSEGFGKLVTLLYRYTGRN